MDIKITLECTGIDWRLVSEILKTVGMAHHKPEAHRRAFEASHTTVFLFHSDQLIGFGRAISDGVYQAAMYDCAILPEFQGKGLGATLIKNILAHISNCNVILYASPGKEEFYQKHEFRKMKTGMALFQNSKSMRERGFTE
jgi:ribosomal protein S18 acetylase RimI-like enzyme